MVTLQRESEDKTLREKEAFDPVTSSIVMMSQLSICTFCEYPKWCRKYSFLKKKMNNSENKEFSNLSI